MERLLSFFDACRPEWNSRFCQGRDKLKLEIINSALNAALRKIHGPAPGSVIATARRPLSCADIMTRIFVARLAGSRNLDEAPNLLPLLRSGGG